MVLLTVEQQVEVDLGGSRVKSGLSMNHGDPGHAKCNLNGDRACHATMGGWQVVTDSPIFPQRPSFATWIGHCGGRGGGNGRRRVRAHLAGARLQGSKVHKDEMSVLRGCDECDHPG